MQVVWTVEPVSLITCLHRPLFDNQLRSLWAHLTERCDVYSVIFLCARNPVTEFTELWDYLKPQCRRMKNELIDGALAYLKQTPFVEAKPVLLCMFYINTSDF